MKKLITAFAFCFSALLIMAQEHMTFKGVEINGSAQVFAENLNAKGFSTVGIEDGNALLTGTYAGQNAAIFAYSTPSSKIIYRVGVVLEGGSQWSLLYNKYSNLKDLLIKKYGNPARCVEEVTESHFKGEELLALHTDKLTYQCEFNNEHGVVRIRIGYNFDFREFIVISYTDAVNGAIAEKEKIDDI